MLNVASESEALAIYAAFVFLVFVGALVWHKYRRDIKKRLPLIHYEHENDDTRKVTTHHA
jgi:hypothetical protein